jgi:hypothetical protein
MTLNEWPEVATTEAAGLITVQHYRAAGQQDDWEYILCSSLLVAGEQYAATCARLQCGPSHQNNGQWPAVNIAYGPVEGELGGKYGSMGTCGVKVTLMLKDPRRPGDWQRPGIDASGRVYIPAYLLRETSIPGYGYMRASQPRESLPPGTVRGGGGDDPVDIGGVLVPQEEMDRVHRETGALPTHVTHDDYSGSFRYLQRIVWGEEPAIIAAEMASR